MVFSSLQFLFLFLPAILLVFYCLPARLRLGSLFLSSLLFYFLGECWLVWILLASSCIDFIAGRIIGHNFDPDSPRTKRQKTALTVSIISNLCFLGYFKYFNFGIDVLSTFITLGTFEEVMLPLGISFYTFQSMSYTIDVYRGNVQASKRPLLFLTYVSMFPQLVAGPIVRYSDIAEQLTNHKVRFEQFYNGVTRFIVGLGKKVLIANMVARAADGIFALDAVNLTPSLAWAGAICYALQIYFDFSGYSDMAIGLGKMFGFDFPENFKYPYIASSIQDFWRRWHISLSTWFRDYLYIPLGGGRGGKWPTYRNLLIVFLLCGLWHGAAWSFLLWGLFHGAFLILERTSFGQLLKRLPVAVGWVYTMLVVLFGWVLFRADALPEALDFYSAMLGLSTPAFPLHFKEFLPNDILIAGFFGILFSYPFLPLWRRLRDKAQRTWMPDVLGQCTLVLIFLVSVVFLMSGSHNPFIYFRF